MEKIENDYVELMDEFKADKAWHVGKVYFDDKKQQVLVKKSIPERMAYERTLNFPYSDLENYDGIEDPTTIEKKHGVGRSIVGGLVAGPTGAVLGAFSGGKSYSAVSKVAMILYFKGNYHIEATFLSTDTSTSSSTYAAVQRSVMQVGHDLDKIIADNNASTTMQAATPSDTSNSTADDLRELKQLLDDGILTEDEFTAKKKQILGI
ncbi:SHOCT domain-containing protein [Lactiplantibacillus daowaiensis]|uniref:SHOCT domain-containing protein n=1 Tax=Lactiplantibacillus daowaiensis TaxID=2559918 RepID=A0ABW1RWS9_9LACO|nr:SHOCT domain-containing protein [Lactiplantibacillus daowaiensis]